MEHVVDRVKGAWGSAALSVAAFIVIVAGSANAATLQVENGRVAAITSAAPAYLHPEPPSDKWPPGTTYIGAVSNGCADGGYAWVVNAQNYIANTSVYTDNVTGIAHTVDFKAACDLHDAGYSGAYVWDAINNRFIDYFGWSKERVDYKFLFDMHKLCDEQIPKTATEVIDYCKETGNPEDVITIGAKSRFNLVNAHGRGYRTRPQLNGTWNHKYGSGCESPWTVKQSGRAITLDFADAAGYRHQLVGTLTTYDPPKPDEIQGQMTVGGDQPSTTAGTMNLTLTGNGSDEIYVHWVPEHGRPFATDLVMAAHKKGPRMTQAAGSAVTVAVNRTSCKKPPSPTTTAPTTTAKPTVPTTLTLTVNGKSDTATTAKPANDDPNPLVVGYGTSLVIAVTANAPMPPGWSIVVRHNGDVLSSSGNYHGVCEVKTGASSCSVTRPPPTAALTGDVDDVVFAQLLAPDHLVFGVQILVNYRK